MQRIIRIKDGVTRMPAWRMAEPVNFELCDGEHIAIVGPNGGGKTMFVNIITGSHPLIGDSIEYDFAPSCKPLVSDNIKYIAFKDSYGDHDSTYYLQQRWNQHDISDDTPTARELLEAAFHETGEDTAERRKFQQHLYSIFSMEKQLDKYIISLSSGELRKFQLIRTLFSSPRVLIMDNPFIGLDIDTRDQLKDLLALLANESSLQIIIVLSRQDDIPPFITHVVNVNDMKVGQKLDTSRRADEQTSTVQQTSRRADKQTSPLLDTSRQVTSRQVTSRQVPSDTRKSPCLLVPCDLSAERKEIIRMSNVCIRYGERTILNNFNWVVNRGEHWAVSGQNGAGKSTLLSLVCADNPQAYACDIALFGKKRGTGESIWEIKRRIGYVSPEMHRAYHSDIPSINVVTSGLKDSIGLYARPNEKEDAVCRHWLDIFGIGHLADRTFLKLSSGEQRMVLLARAFVKDPELLILDEPFHGLDNDNRIKATEIIETFCKRQDKTLIMVSHYPEELPPCIDHTLTLVRTT